MTLSRDGYFYRALNRYSWGSAKQLHNAPLEAKKFRKPVPETAMYSGSSSDRCDQSRPCRTTGRIRHVYINLAKLTKDIKFGRTRRGGHQQHTRWKRNAAIQNAARRKQTVCPATIPNLSLQFRQPVYTPNMDPKVNHPQPIPDRSDSSPADRQRWTRRTSSFQRGRSVTD